MTQSQLKVLKQEEFIGLNQIHPEKNCQETLLLKKVNIASSLMTIKIHTSKKFMLNLKRDIQEYKIW